MSLISGTIAAFKGSAATTEAADTAAAAQDRATQVSNEQFNKQVELNQPFYEIGKANLPAFQSMISGNYDMKESPAAQYQLTKGTKAMNRALASRGLSGSGNAAQRLTELNQSVAASDWQAQYQRITDALKLGTGASASMGSAGQNLTSSTQAGAQNLGNIAMQQGQNQASLYSGLGGLTSNAAATGLRAADLYNRWGTTNTAANAAANNWTTGEGAAAAANLPEYAAAL
jgi:hypothetical protein